MKTIKHDGKTYTIAQWSEVTGLTVRQINYGLSKGLTLGDILAGKKPSQGNPEKSLRAAAAEAGIPYKTVYARIQRGMSIEEALK